MGGDIVKKQIYIGVESFEEIREGDYFYIDKTLFIKELFENKSAAAVVVEPKHLKSEPQDLKEEARKGLEQVEEKAYARSLKAEGYGRIHRFGIAFYKKTCEVAMMTS